MRYCFPFFFTSIIYAALHLLVIHKNFKIQSLKKFIGVLIPIVLVGGLIFSPKMFIDRSKANFYFFWHHSDQIASSVLFDINGLRYPILEDEGERSYYQNLQSRIPSGEKILVQVNKPYLFNFKRNVIFNAGNCPGATSPPPGIPLSGSNDELRNYLIDLNVRYIVIEYKEYIDPNGKYYKFTDTNMPWDKTCNKATTLFGKRIPDIGKVKFDDGAYRILSL